jgi:orotate phosphoribosyltransferase
VGALGIQREEHPSAERVVPAPAAGSLGIGHRGRLCSRAVSDDLGGRDELVRRMVEASELHGAFVLSSGKTSSVYFDKFRFLTRADLLREVARAVAEVLAPDTALLGAPEGAAMLLVAAVSLETGLPVTVVRKQAKEYGTRAQVEGVVDAGAVTTLVEDVSTTGHQVQRAAEVLADAGADVRRIVLAIDRGGADHLRAAGYDVRAVAVLRPAD